MMLDAREFLTRSVKVSAAIALACFMHAGAASAADEPTVHGVQFHQKGHGWLLSDPKGMTLYVFAQDQEPGTSRCVDGCARVWTPYEAKAEDKGEGEWSVIKRPDNSLQWAYRNKPLYTYTRDTAAGTTNGDGLQAGAWAVAFKEIAMPPGMKIVKTLKGWVLADGKSMTLYTSDGDSPKKIGCDVECARTWHPLRASWLAADTGDWSVVTRPDGSRQWAYKGKPLYTYERDGVIEDTRGDGAAKGWKAAVLEPPPPVPSWVTVQAADDCDIYGDSKGMTIYVHDVARGRRVPGGIGRGPEANAAKADDDGPMMRPQDWTPVLAKDDDKGVGDWSVYQRQDGRKQWAYKGLLLYNNVNDQKPGNINGHRRHDLTWRVVTVSGKLMNGTGA